VTRASCRGESCAAPLALQDDRISPPVANLPRQLPARLRSSRTGRSGCGSSMADRSRWRRRLWGLGRQAAAASPAWRRCGSLTTFSKCWAAAVAASCQRATSGETALAPGFARRAHRFPQIERSPRFASTIGHRASSGSPHRRRPELPSGSAAPVFSASATSCPSFSRRPCLPEGRCAPVRSARPHHDHGVASPNR